MSNSNILYEKPYQYEPPPIKPIKKPKPQSNPFPNPYGNHRPDFGMPPISKITQILKKPKPKQKPLNSFALEAIKLLGGRGQVNTPLTKQHGEKLISARHDLPMHAPLSEKQNIYDIEEKAFETMQKPNATLGDFYKNIGAIDDDDQQSKNRSEVQKARIDMAKNRRVELNLQAKNNKDIDKEKTLIINMRVNNMHKLILGLFLTPMYLLKAQTLEILITPQPSKKLIHLICMIN